MDPFWFILKVLLFPHISKDHCAFILIPSFQFLNYILPYFLDIPPFLFHLPSIINLN